ncbi:COG3014 family protein [Marinobacter mobilis]|uniref:COG3014 family protein n=1 Tax=Marinobacter mobilis TaxID=488533 RepID=UPI0035C7811C
MSAGRRDGGVWLGIAALVLLVTGCSSFSQRDQMARFNAAYASGEYVLAAEAMDYDADEFDDPGTSGRSESGSDVLESLHQGEALRLAGDYARSVAAYDRAEAGMKYLDTEGNLIAVWDNLSSILLNDASLNYRALMSEAILVNTYKGLDFLALADAADARVEFNRADDRTRRAVDFFSEEIRDRQQDLQQDPANARMVYRTLDSRDLQQALDERYGNPSQWQVFADYMVPASTYLHGLFFLAAGTGGADTDKALTSLRRVAGMVPGNEVLSRDVALAEALASGRQSRQQLSPQVWVVYENGLGPVLEEVRFDIPLPVSHNDYGQIVFAVVALPRYRDRSSVPGHLVVAGADEKPAVTEPMASMGRVIQTELQARFPGVLMRAVSAAVLKGMIQVEAAESMGALGQFGAILYTVSTTQADLRSWQALPDHWQVARIERPADGQLTLTDSRQGVLGTLELPQWPFTLVYIKRPTAGSAATAMVLDLQGEHAGQYLTLPAGSGTEK